MAKVQGYVGTRVSGFKKSSPLPSPSPVFSQNPRLHPHPTSNEILTLTLSHTRGFSSKIHLTPHPQETRFLGSVLCKTHAKLFDVLKYSKIDAVTIRASEHVKFG